MPEMLFRVSFRMWAIVELVTLAVAPPTTRMPASMVMPFGTGPWMVRSLTVTIAAFLISTRELSPKSGVSVIGAWMMTPGAVPIIVRLC